MRLTIVVSGTHYFKVILTLTQPSLQFSTARNSGNNIKFTGLATHNEKRTNKVLSRWKTWPTNRVILWQYWFRHQLNCLQAIIGVQRLSENYTKLKAINTFLTDVAPPTLFSHLSHYGLLLQVERSVTGRRTCDIM